MESYFIEVIPERFNSVFPLKKVKKSFVRSMKELREIHEGDCGHHAGSKSLVAKAFRHGFYWLTESATIPRWFW